jgi:hypothetical protein
MPKRLPKVPRATVSGPSPKASISADDWRRIESAYGRRLSPELRERIHELTNSYFEFTVIERAAPTMDLAKKRIKDIRSKAKALRRALLDSNKDGDAALYADHLLALHLNDPRLNVTSGLESFINVITSFVAACDEAWKKVNDSKVPTYEGEQWSLWVRRLTRILADAGLPTSVRKDTDKNKPNRPSPFVAFIRELQFCVPARHQHSNVALATAIHKAQRPPRVAWASRVRGKKTRNR